MHVNMSMGIALILHLIFIRLHLISNVSAHLWVPTPSVACKDTHTQKFFIVLCRNPVRGKTNKQKKTWADDQLKISH